MQELKDLEQKIAKLINVHRVLTQENASLRAQLAQAKELHSNDRAWEDEKLAIRSTIDELLVHIESVNTTQQER